MLHRYWFWALILGMSSMLGAGCRSAPAGDSIARANKAASPPHPESGSDRPSKRAAQAHAHYGAGVILEMEDEPEAALKEYEQAALEDLDNEWLMLDVSRRLLQNRQPERALELLTRAAARPNVSGALQARLAMVYSHLGKQTQAVLIAQSAIQKSPNLLAGYQTLFVVYLQTKREPEALQLLDSAARQPKLDPEFLIGLSEMYATCAIQAPAQRDRANASALALLVRADKLKPTDPMLRVRLADGFNLLGQSQRAAQVYLDLLNKLPDVPMLRERVHAKLADIYFQGKDRKKAIEQLEAVIGEDPTNPQAYYFLGSLAYDVKDLVKAAENFSKAILLSPDFEQAYYDLALAQISMEKPSDALATLAQARKKFPQNFVQEFWTAVACSREKAYKEALQHFTAAEVIAKATEPERLNQLFYFEAGAAFERTGDLAQAENYFEKCLKLAPDFTEAMNYLGYMWAEHGTNLDRAHDLLEKAVKAEPKNAAFLDSLGWVLYKLNRPADALGYELKAVELSEHPDATVYDHLGDIFAALKQPGKARDAWARSLQLEPNDQVRKKLAP
jgi:tetratricopeptide (TPR) repeat protein